MCLVMAHGLWVKTKAKSLLVCTCVRLNAHVFLRVREPVHARRDLAKCGEPVAPRVQCIMLITFRRCRDIDALCSCIQEHIAFDV